MSEYEPSQTAQAIERARMARKMSVRRAAAVAGMSEGRWRQIAKGYQSAAKGVRVPVNAPPETLARMANAVGLTFDALSGVADDDTVAALLDLQAPPQPPGEREALLAWAESPSGRAERAHLEALDWLEQGEGEFPPYLLHAAPDAALIRELARRLASRIPQAKAGEDDDSKSAPIVTGEAEGESWSAARTGTAPSPQPPPGHESPDRP